MIKAVIIITMYKLLRTMVVLLSTRFLIINHLIFIPFLNSIAIHSPSYKHTPGIITIIYDPR